MLNKPTNNYSLLSYLDLVKLVEEGVINALIENINAASIDIRIGDDIKALRNNHIIDVNTPENINYENLKFDCYDEFLLDGHQLIYANSLETFNLPNDIACLFRLKSSMARVGLDHIEAGWCDPGWSNSTYTFALYNLNKTAFIKLKKGMKIGQMVFFKCLSAPDNFSYKNKGKYNDQKDATLLKK